MPAPRTAAEFLQVVEKSQLVDRARIDAALNGAAPATAADCARLLFEAGLITKFQTDQLLKGKYRGFNVGRYRVLDRLGSGGMGQVFLCEHPHLRRRAAVKVLPTERAKDPALLGRFLREARAAAGLDHPNIVRAFDVDQENGLHYLVMEYIEGPDLYHVVKKKGPLPVPTACEYIRQAAIGLQYAHEAGLIHRDVKPSNFLLEVATGTVKLLDLGLARFTEESPDALTQRFDNNNVLGTADYVAPEQTRDSHEVDHRCDIYALGGTLYFLLTGQSPFPDGTPADKMIGHRQRKPTPVRSLRPDVPAGLAVVIDKMMAKNPDERFESAAEVAEAVAPWLPNAAGPSAPAPASVGSPLLPSLSSLAQPSSPPPPARVRFSLGWSGVTLVVIIACGFGAVAGRWLPDPSAVTKLIGGR
jgi:serine/threonine protein kinase